MYQLKFKINLTKPLAGGMAPKSSDEGVPPLPPGSAVGPDGANLPGSLPAPGINGEDGAGVGSPVGESEDAEGSAEYPPAPTE